MRICIRKRLTQGPLPWELAENLPNNLLDFHREYSKH